MENEKSTENQILSEKLNTYRSEWANDFSCPGELMVQITLSEYRHLVKKDATTKQKIDEADSKWLKAYREAEQLKEENAELKEKIVKLASMDEKTNANKDADEDE